MDRDSANPMSPVPLEPSDPFLQRALRAARDTQFLAMDAGVRHSAAAIFASLFGAQPAVIVADVNTYNAAGRDVVESFRRAGHPCIEPFVFGPDVAVEMSCVRALQSALEPAEAIPLAVGSGTINDLTKLVVHRLGRPYLILATAASMDGYTAFGASITDRGSKQTFDCPAPRAVLADLEVIACAPKALNAAGYADLLAKSAAGADWIVADAVGAEPIDPTVWELVQSRLRSWIASPQAIAQSNPEALRHLVTGLLLSGFAMQAARSSRPASGAEHQFSHLWDMQHHTYQGAAPSHGFKVGIGTLAALALYEDLLGRDLARLDVEGALAIRPTLESLEARIVASLGSGELAEKAREETRAKFPTSDTLRAQLTRLRQVWPELRARLVGHLIPFREARAMLGAAGCPCEPEQIGISRRRLRLSYEQATFIRRRFTILDLAERTGVMEPALDRLFGPGGPWPAP
jgi:glycerol-1-phosphate dehydrogenase [NAD(P)+]